MRSSRRWILVMVDHFTSRLLRERPCLRRGPSISGLAGTFCLKREMTRETWGLTFLARWLRLKRP